ncbi:MAG: hypothetical protein ACI8PT_000491 [Gammaproteobacteria bacterium]|jgi:hypothetical protein
MTYEVSYGAKSGPGLASRARSGLVSCSDACTDMGPGVGKAKLTTISGYILCVLVLGAQVLIGHSIAMSLCARAQALMTGTAFLVLDEPPKVSCQYSRCGPQKLSRDHLVLRCQF